MQKQQTKTALTYHKKFLDQLKKKKLSPKAQALLAEWEMHYQDILKELGVENS